MIELLSPAGSYEAFLAAICAGADAVYVGGNRYGARAYASNFSEDELLKAIDYAHLYGRKLYLTVNTLCKDEELAGLYDFLNPLYCEGLDGVIVQDLGVISYIRRCFPELPVHASTQMTLTSAQGAQYLKSLGAERIVPSRELSLSEIRQIKDTVDIEIESFIHGAMCYCYSGQCLFSGILGGRSGNRGRCAQPCRLPYDVYESGRQQNSKKEQYLLSMRDMCTLELIPQLIEAGVESFKIEGRMKKSSYTSGVTAIYRKYFDLYQERGKEGFQVAGEDIQKLMTLYSRSGSRTWYYEQRNGREMITLKKPGYESQTADEVVTQMEKIQITGEFSCRVGEAAVLHVNCGDRSVQVTGFMVEPSEKHPATAEDVKKQLQKTGDTSFAFAKLTCQIEGDCFLPVKALNELRRTALEELSAQLLQSGRRECGSRKNQTENQTEDSALEAVPDRPLLSAVIPSVSMLERLGEVDKLTVFYLESDVLFEKNFDFQRLLQLVDKLHQQDKKIMLALPYIFRMGEQKKLEQVWADVERMRFDGWLLRNYEELFWAKQQKLPGEWVSDFNLYSFQKEAKKQLENSGITCTTAPLELNARELGIRGVRDSEMLLYGSLPMMISAQCLRKTTAHCSKSAGTVILKDRYQTEFPIQCHCAFCYNVILNSVPLSLHNEEKSLRRLHPARLRLQFTIETPDESYEIARYYTDCLGEGKSQPPFAQFTKGHFKRGVE